jgi:hypothetical protein
MIDFLIILITIVTVYFIIILYYELERSFKK